MEKNIKIVSIAIILLLVTFCSGCKTVRSWGEDGSTDYYKPETVGGADYAIRERIHYLENELEQANDRLAKLADRFEHSKAIVNEIRKSGEAIGELSRRSAASVQEIIAQMEDLVLWITWATGRIQYLESILASENEY